MQRFFSIVADIIALAHGLIMALFFVPLTCYALNLDMNVYFLLSMLSMLVVGLLYNLLTGTCPLTVMEHYCRSKAGVHVYDGSFVIYYLNKIFGLDLSSCKAGYNLLSTGMLIGFVLIGVYILINKQLI